jgi:hypothetical protein
VTPIRSASTDSTGAGTSAGVHSSSLSNGPQIVPTAAATVMAAVQSPPPLVDGISTATATAPTATKKPTLVASSAALAPGAGSLTMTMAGRGSAASEGALHGGLLITSPSRSVAAATGASSNAGSGGAAAGTRTAGRDRSDVGFRDGRPVGPTHPSPALGTASQPFEAPIALNPIAPCGSCTEWLKKIAEVCTLIFFAFTAFPAMF